MGEKYLNNIDPEKRLKKIHDLLAVTCFFNREICDYYNIKLTPKKNKWMSILSPNSNQKISISYNRELFIKELIKN